MAIGLKAPRLPKIGKRGFFSIIVLVGLLNASVGYMYVEAKKSDITVLYIEGAPEDIVFIADPHLREQNIDHTLRIIDEINTLAPSLVLIGGDFAYESESDFHYQDVWNRVDAPVYAVLGNHDYKAGLTSAGWIGKNLAVSGCCYDVEGYDVTSLRDDTTDLAFAGNLEEILEENGITVLKNEYRELNLNGTELLLVGVDDGWAGMADPPDVPANAAFTLYMIHEPECRADWDADLILSGHTHGGQFLPDNLPVPGRELSGLVERNGVKTYITRGIGTSNLEIELRLFATPEIVVINPSTPPEEIFSGEKISYVRVDG
jgi:predicted MPP superfamily phosphohydrolase